MKRLLVTGWDGFVGSNVRDMFGNGKAVGEFQVVIPPDPMELLDKGSLERAVRNTRPDCVLHLAAQSFVPSSIDDPRATFNVNFYGTLNLLEALRVCDFGGRMLYVGSGEVYGWVEPAALPVTEKQLLRPRNPYSVSKAAAELLCYQWTQTQGFDIVIARPFNHIGPRQSERFVIPNFARQIVEVKLGLREPVIKVGSIDVTRDFTDVRDVIRAYACLLEYGKRGEVYNVCSGQERNIQSGIEQMMAIADVSCKILPDEKRMRPSEHKRMYGSYAKLNKQTGWQPLIDFHQSLRDVLSEWECRLKNG